MSYYSDRDVRDILEKEIHRVREVFDRERVERERAFIDRIAAGRYTPPPSWSGPAAMPTSRPLGPPPKFLDEYRFTPSIDQTKLDALKAVEPRKAVRPGPDLISVITGWRGWRLALQNGERRLMAAGNNHIWEPRKQVDAKCLNTTSHPAPQRDCQCGVWAFKSLDLLVPALATYAEVKVLGTVSMWGRVIETENGYRSQFAYPSELWLLDDSLEELSWVYDVPVRVS